jgi:arginase
VTIQEIEPVDESHPEIVRAIQLIRRLVGRIKQTVAYGAFPLILAGNCDSALGTTARVTAADAGVIWFGRMRSSTTRGERVRVFDVMGLAMRDWATFAGAGGSIRGHVPAPEQKVILAGV